MLNKDRWHFFPHGSFLNFENLRFLFLSCGGVESAAESLILLIAEMTFVDFECSAESMPSEAAPGEARFKFLFSLFSQE